MNMKRSLHNRELRLIIGKRYIKQIEKFVEVICDDNHIYDEYYANIVTANTMFAEHICKLSNCDNYKADVKFIRDKRGLHFIYHVGDLFLDIASSHDKIVRYKFENLDNEDDKVESLMPITLLCDDFVTDSENETIELFFKISGVNEMLSVQRIELLKKYYAMIHSEVKQ